MAVGPGFQLVCDDSMEINVLPEELIGHTVVRPNRWARNNTRLFDLFRRT
jgi:hypothetical protein